MNIRTATVLALLFPLAFAFEKAAALENKNTLQLSHSLSIQHLEKNEHSPKQGTVTDLLEESKKWLPGTASCAIQPDQHKKLSLKRTLQIVLCQHPRLQEARAQVEEQMTDLNISKLARRPEVQTSLQYSAQKDGQTSFSDTTRKGLSAGLSASWILFDFGQQSANIRAADLQLQSSIASERNTSLTVLREALEQYISASTSWANLIAAQKTLDIAQRTHEFARARYNAKVGTQIDQLQAQTAFYQAELELVRADGEWKDAQTALALAMGLPETESLSLDTSDTDPNFAAPLVPQSPMGRQKDRHKTWHNHPRVQTIQNQILALDELREASRASNLGQISLDFFTGQVNDEISGFQESRTNSVGNIRASIPLFTADIQRERDQKLLKQQAAAKATQLEAIRDLQREHQQAQEGVQLSRNTQQISNHLLTTAERAHEIALGRFKAGVGSIIELLDAQVALTNARRQQANAQADVLRQQIRLLLASGQYESSPRN